jgi:serine/threonine protein kinase
LEKKEGDVLAGRYRIMAFLGRGGMAEVYKVWDKDRSVPLALKLLYADLAQDRVFLRRFKREAVTLSRLQHPNIVRFYGLEQDGLQAFILMDYIDGNILRSEIFQLNGTPMPAGRILEIMRPVCAALHYAHQVGVVHCDVKPANIMIDRSGKVLVADFGIARLAEGATTTTLVGAGTPAYMAPELVRGENPSPQTDIYALGIVLYEMLTGGERPFTGEQATITGTTGEKVRWEQVHARPIALRQFNPKISPDLEGSVFKCLEKDPHKRFADTLDLLSAIEKALSPVSVHAAAQPVVPSWVESVRLLQVEERHRRTAEDKALKENEEKEKRVTEEKNYQEQLQRNRAKQAEEKGNSQGEPRKAWFWDRWAVVEGIVLVIGVVWLVALAGWEIAKHTSGLVAMQTVSTPSALPRSATQALSTSAMLPTSTIPLLPIDTGSTLTSWPTSTRTPAPTNTETPPATKTPTRTLLPTLTKTPDVITLAKSIIVGEWISDHESSFEIYFYSNGTFETIDKGTGCDGKYLVGGWPSINGYRPLLTLYDHCMIQKQEMGSLDFYDKGNSISIRCDLEIICAYTGDDSYADFHRK